MAKLTLLECNRGCGATTHNNGTEPEHGWTCTRCLAKNPPPDRYHDYCEKVPPHDQLLKLTGWSVQDDGLWAHPTIVGHHATTVACRLTIGEMVVLDT